ncbi:MAG: phosphate signaling complex protein PhoU [Victivallales bacterium]|jgi:phosphate transport system protein|nr:phosphate signaling complex protein PhoU [Victivallales bacterium]
MKKTHFAKAIDELKIMLFEVATLAEEATNIAVSAVESNNVNIATKVINDDTKIDALEIKIEEECLKILALYQPVAGDLRNVITILKVNNEIERIGDLAVNIAERVADMNLYWESCCEKIDFQLMVKMTCSMLKDALDSLAYEDVTKAVCVIRSDDIIDSYHKENYQKVRDYILKYPKEAQYYMDCLTVSRCLERIADIATNIAEDVVYLESGTIVRHQHEGEEHARQ